MPTQFLFELVSPEKLLASKQVTLVTVPGEEGDYGVLAGHAPLITTVRPGVIEVYADQTTTVTERIFVAGGFAEVTQERCTVLAEQALPVSEIDRGKLDEEARTVSDSIAQAKSNHERAALETQLAVVKAKQAALNVHTTH